MPERISVVAFEARHLLDLGVRVEERNLGDLMSPEILKALTASFARTFLYENQPLFCAGLYLVRPGVAELWWRGHPDVVRHPIEVVRTSKWYLEKGAAALKIWRAQAAVNAEWPAACRFAEICGLEREGTMRQFGPNREDFYMYARIFA